jgi:subtilisin family serine protease
MKKTLQLLIAFFVTFSAFSQEDAWVYFNAKPNATFYLEAPLTMLSQRALDRRANQNIALDFKDVPIEASYSAQIKAATGIVVMAKSKWLNALHIRGSVANINALKLFSFVEKVDFADRTLNSAGKKTTITKVKTTNKKLETQVDYGYGNSANQIQMLNGQTMHQQNYTGSGKIIAVMDAGFPGVNTALPFQRLRDNNQILGGYDYVLRNPDFYTGSSHGTSVLSTMGGYKENFLVGTAPDASYYLFITEDDTSENPVEESLWVEAAEKADSLGVDVINTSLGYSDEHTNPAYDYSYSDMNGATTFISKGAEIAFSRGMIIVVSAGNSGGSANPYISAPADAISVIAVGAVTPTENLASFSSTGPSFDGRIKPDVMAQGYATVLSNESGDIVTSSGTSFSSPIMTGMIACLWQAFPEKTNQEIKQLLFESADKFATPNYQFGYGIPDFALAITNGLVLEQFNEGDFKIYPNPTNDILSISFPKKFNQGTLSIYTVFGQKVLEQNISNQFTTTSLQKLNQGMYLYKLESNGYSKTGKIIKH